MKSWKKKNGKHFILSLSLFSNLPPSTASYSSASSHRLSTSPPPAIAFSSRSTLIHRWEISPKILARMLQRRRKKVARVGVKQKKKGDQGGRRTPIGVLVVSEWLVRQPTIIDRKKGGKLRAFGSGKAKEKGRGSGLGGGIGGLAHGDKGRSGLRENREAGTAGCEVWGSKREKEGQMLWPRWWLPVA